MPIFNHGKNTRVLFVDDTWESDVFTIQLTSGSPIVTVVQLDFPVAKGTFLIDTNGYLGYGATVISVNNDGTLTLDANSTGTDSVGQLVTAYAGNSGLSLDVSQFFNDVSTSRPTEATETTTFQTGGSKSYIVGLRDGTITMSGFFEGTINGVDNALRYVLGQKDDITALVFPDGGTGAPSATSPPIANCFMAQGIETKYDLKSPVNGVVAVDAEIQADGGIWSGEGVYWHYAYVGEAPAMDAFSQVHTHFGDTGHGGVLVLGVLDITGGSYNPPAVATSDSDITFPLTITASTNDTFQVYVAENTTTYTVTIPAGTYSDEYALGTALSTALSAVEAVLGSVAVGYPTASRISLQFPHATASDYIQEGDGGAASIGFSAVPSYFVLTDTVQPLGIAIVMQHSADNSTWVQLGSQMNGSAPSIIGADVQELSGTIYKYTRLHLTVTGDNPSAKVYYGLARH